MWFPSCVLFANSCSQQLFRLSDRVHPLVEQGGFFLFLEDYVLFFRSTFHCYCSPFPSFGLDQFLVTKFDHFYSQRLVWSVNKQNNFERWLSGERCFLILLIFV